MQYSPKYAGNLPPWLGALSNVCLTLMGGIDCIVFFWREKPWRHTRSRTASTAHLLRNDDGSHDLEKGSGVGDGDANSKPVSAAPSEKQSTIASLRSNFKGRMSSLLPKRPAPVTRSASTIAKQRAYDRLALEIQDRKEMNRRSVDGQQQSQVQESGSAANAQGLGVVDAAAEAEAERAGSAVASASTAKKGPKHWWDRQDSVSVW